MDELKPCFSQILEKDFTDKLFPYQLEGIKWLTDRKVALLADEMGLGKSAQSIIAADKTQAQRILIICPAVARLNWEREFKKFSSFRRNFTIVNTSKTHIDENDSVIVSADLATRLSPAALGKFDVVILDEVHYFKNTQTKRTRAIFGKQGVIHGQKSSTKIWALSGTPAPNHAGELWPLLFTFGRTRLSYEDFIQRFCVITKRTFGNKVQDTIAGTRKERIPELRQILNGIMLRRTKDSVGHMLPKIFFSNIVVEEGEVDLTQESSFVKYVLENRIDELEQKLKAEIQQVKKAIATRDIEILKGLAKSVSTLRRYIGIQKVEKTAELVKSELEANLYEKIVIFAIHRDVIEGLRVRLKDFGALTLYGGTRFDSANKHIDKFQTNPRARVFIGNITACGIAIDLTASNQVLMIEQEWTPAANAQAIARCHRHGQKKPVSVRVVGLANSLDEKIAETLKKKMEELTEIFDGVTQPNTFEDLIS